MNTPNTNENENLKKNASQVPYKYETEHTYMEFIFIWAAALTPNLPPVITGDNWPRHGRCTGEQSHSP